MKLLAKKKRRLSVHIDMTPMVDIAFLLLIFYMTTTIFKPPEKGKVELPESESKITMPDAAKIEIVVTRDNSVFIDYMKPDSVLVDGAFQSRSERVYAEVSPEKIGAAVQAARTANRNAYLVLKADRKADFGTIEAIMAELRRVNMPRFQIVTEKERETLAER
ncbi:MAG: biopolymer transporter ExbD [Candidatus Zixiibacteriota bacterium]